MPAVLGIHPGKSPVESDQAYVEATFRKRCLMERKKKNHLLTET